MSYRSPLLLRQVVGRLAGEFLHRAEASCSQPQALAKQHLRLFQSQAQALPRDAAAQARHLRELNQGGQHEAVVQLFERGGAASSEGALGEYVKALVAVNRLDGSAVSRLLAEGAAARAGASGLRAGAPLEYGAAASSSAPLGQQAPGFLGGQGAAAGVIGSAKNPVHMTQAEMPFRAQLWKTFRTLALTFVIISGIGALVDEQGGGLTRGIMNNPDVRPQLETKTKFADVRGVDEAKAELEEVVQYLRDPHRFTLLGGKLPKGVLLVGPPGTGKTMLARAVAGEAGVPFLYCSGSEFEEMFVGVGARRVRDLFAAAKKHSPCIVFMDEIDAIGGARTGRDAQYMKMTLNQLLVELDGFKPSEGVIVIAATNVPESLDHALVRPGRFDRHVTVPNPDVRGRAEILESHSRNVPLAGDVDMQVIARGTPGFSGADLANLINVAALHAAQRGLHAVNMAALEHAKDRILMGAERKSAVRATIVFSSGTLQPGVISEGNRKLTAYHEGGHALVALLTEGAHPVHKATIVPRGMALGMVTQLPKADELSVSRRQLLAKLDVCMGGRVAEELIFGDSDVTTGASSDLQQASRLALAMVTKYGMSEVVGPTALNYEDNGRSLSSETRAAVEAEVKRLVSSAYSRAKQLLQRHEADLHTLAKALLEQETLTGRQIAELLQLAGSAGAAAAARRAEE